MPQERLFTNGVFTPDAIKAMTTAYAHLCIALHLNDPTDALAEAAAKRIIEHARRGERNAVALAQLVLKDLRHSSL
jgi:hypothetical protein